VTDPPTVGDVEHRAGAAAKMLLTLYAYVLRQWNELGLELACVYDIQISGV